MSGSFGMRHSVFQKIEALEMNGFEIYLELRPIDARASDTLGHDVVGFEIDLNTVDDGVTVT